MLVCKYHLIDSSAQRKETKKKSNPARILYFQYSIWVLHVDCTLKLYLNQMNISYEVTFFTSTALYFHRPSKNNVPKTTVNLSNN